MIIYWLFYIGYMIIVLADIRHTEEYYEARNRWGGRIRQSLCITALAKTSIVTCILLAMIDGRQFAGCTSD